MLCQLASSHDNGQSMVIPSGMKYGSSFVKTNDNDQIIVIAPSGMKHVRHLSSSHDNGQSIAIPPLGIKHTLSVAIVS